jgi:fructose-1,6-bisphosphatase/inositol monophosphatase family enzyme
VVGVGVVGRRVRWSYRSTTSTDGIDSNRLDTYSHRVTETDKLNEKLVMELLKSHFPEHQFIGEVILGPMTDGHGDGCPYTQTQTDTQPIDHSRS